MDFISDEIVFVPHFLSGLKKNKQKELWTVINASSLKEGGYSLNFSFVLCTLQCFCLMNKWAAAVISADFFNVTT